MAKHYLNPKRKNLSILQVCLHSWIDTQKVNKINYKDEVTETNSEPSFFAKIFCIKCSMFSQIRSASQEIFSRWKTQINNHFQFNAKHTRYDLILKLVSKELNYWWLFRNIMPGVWFLWSKRKTIIIFQKKREILLHF